MTHTLPATFREKNPPDSRQSTKTAAPDSTIPHATAEEGGGEGFARQGRAGASFALGADGSGLVGLTVGGVGFGQFLGHIFCSRVNYTIFL